MLARVAPYAFQHGSSNFERDVIVLAYTIVRKEREVMSWNPSINFSLRDDQTVFGDYIVDKSGVSELCVIFQDAKTTGNVDTERLLHALNEWCYTNDEFKSLQDEFDLVKQDIAFFKKECSSFGIAWTASIKSVGIAMDYVAGSSTWLQKYKENKKIAASLYMELKRKGYRFSPETQVAIEHRYGEVISSSTDTELVEEYLKKQYKEKLLNGDPGAMEEYTNALVETGCMNRETAERNARIMASLTKAGGSTVAKQAEAPRIQHANSQETVEKSDPETYTHKLLSDWFLKIKDLDKRGYPAEAGTVIAVWNKVVLGLMKECDPLLLSSMESTSGDEWDTAQVLWKKIKASSFKNMLECSFIDVPAEVADNMNDCFMRYTGFGFNTESSDESVPMTRILMSLMCNTYHMTDDKVLRDQVSGYIINACKMVGITAPDSVNSASYQTLSTAYMEYGKWFDEERADWDEVYPVPKDFAVYVEQYAGDK